MRSRLPSGRLRAVQYRIIDWPRRFCPMLEHLDDRSLPSVGYFQINLASDIPGLATVTDQNLINPWGLTFSPTGPFWLGENGSGVSDLLAGDGQVVPLVVNVSSAGGRIGQPTGVVFNAESAFVVSQNGLSQSGEFLFATGDGTISVWAPEVNPTQAIVAVNHSFAGANFTGLALASDSSGQSFLYAADFSRGTIDVFNEQFQQDTQAGAFQDPTLPSGFSPFNVQNIDGLLYVTYARQGAGGDTANNLGAGAIDVFDPSGKLLSRFASGGSLDAPWGLAIAPAGFGTFAGDLLVGNNGDGHISAFDPKTGAFLGQLTDNQGATIAIPNLWALSFGNDHEGGAGNALFFTAGLDNEQHGLFGAIQTAADFGHGTAGAGSFNPNAPGERIDYPLPPAQGPTLHGVDLQILPAAGLLPAAEGSTVVIPTLTSFPIPGSASPTIGSPPSGSATAMTQLMIGATALVSGSDSPISLETMPGDMLALNSFLDLNAIQLPAESPSGLGAPLDIPSDFVAQDYPRLDRAGTISSERLIIQTPSDSDAPKHMWAAVPAPVAAPDEEKDQISARETGANPLPYVFAICGIYAVIRFSHGWPRREKAESELLDVTQLIDI